MATEVWDSGQGYEAFIGRWSRQVAPRFLDWLPGTDAGRWCDVGCGTGALATAVLADPARVAVFGVDPSEAFLATARSQAGDARLRVIAASAVALPLADDAVDRVVSGLVLNFVPSPAAAVREMRRVTRPGGLVAAYLWDYADGMRLLRAFWDAATAEDPAAADLDEGRRFALCRPDAMESLFRGAGLVTVRTTAIDVESVYRDFDELWRPFLDGQGPAPGYCVSLAPDRQAAVRERLRSSLTADADGSIRLTARAWAVQGTVP